MLYVHLRSNRLEHAWIKRCSNCHKVIWDQEWVTNFTICNKCSEIEDREMEEEWHKEEDKYISGREVLRDDHVC